ncbi:MAG TPA: hypothetical protein VN721_00435 [Flavipsychrobacter sp.]|nr:hypothetical protein [Flavipsychrobacter sp.]
MIRDLMMIEISILFLWVSGENRNNTSADDDLQYRKRDYTKYFFISWLIIFSAFLAIDSIELYHLRSNSFLERIRDILILPLVATIVWIEILRKRKNWWQYLGYAGWIFLIIVFCFRNYFSPTVFVSLLILDAIITGAYFFMKKGQRSKNQN